MSTQLRLTPNHHYNTRVVYFDQHGTVVSVQECRRHQVKAAEATTFQVLERYVNFEVSSKFFNTDGSALAINVLAEKLESGELTAEEQSVDVGDDKITFNYKGWKTVFQIHTYNPKGNISGETLGDWLSTIPKDILAYLKGLNERGPSYNFIPSGFGWDGKLTHLDLFYMFKMRQLLIGNWRWTIDKEVIDSLSEQYMLSPVDSLKTDWKKAIVSPKGTKYQVGEISNQSEVYVFMQNDQHSYHCKNIDRNTTEFTLEPGYDRCVVVVTNVLAKDSRQTGLAVILYKEISDD